MFWYPLNRLNVFSTTLERQLLVRRHEDFCQRRDVFIENWIWNVKMWLHFLREREFEYKMQVLCYVKHKILGFHLLEPNRAAEPSMCHCLTVLHVVWIARSSASSSVKKKKTRSAATWWCYSFIADTLLLLWCAEGRRQTNVKRIWIL